MPDTRLGGTIWHRRYLFPDGPQTAATTKRSGGDGALVESFNRWFGMHLVIRETRGELQFVSEDFFAEWRGQRFHLPGWLSPGRLVVVHRDEGDGRFRFTMTLNHPLFGILLHQDGVFFDPED